ncbi:Csu type fimbrial protein [Pragia fontium]|uniref:Spore coat protein U (SCPU) domain-containing protein n=1 Tax=Pragia fontium DSM 5563 = ATCC 49100 TaxID=1122977 RepID=A0AAJ4WAT7_9GAMM|nr:spore coat U domain-containing protein [Pragia fontium]SFC87099.1 Spore coat protein U (SCPU) domain-containing protein [Pragia fontium DSM 5563 = ATCC 49100]VEJ56083.1 Uncharacterized secreted protein [Pragia fontium]
MSVCNKCNQSIVLMLTFMPLSPAFSVTTKSASVTISANVVAACNAGSISGGNTTFGTLNFGTYSILNQEIKLTGQANAGAILVQCAPGVNYQIVMNGGNSGNTNQRYMSGNQFAQHVNYNLYSDANYSTIWDGTTGITKTATGQQEWVNVYGRVPSQSSPVADTYTDTVQVTVSW